MSDLPDGVSESLFYQHPNGKVVELLSYRRAPDLSFGLPAKKKRKKAPGGVRKKRDVLIKVHGMFCHYCKRLMLMPDSAPQNNKLILTIEHIVPRSLGGPNSSDNLLLACAGCNNGLGSEYVKCRCVLCEHARVRYGKNDSQK